MTHNEGLQALLLNAYLSLQDSYNDTKSLEYWKGRKEQLDVLFEMMADNYAYDSERLEHFYNQDFHDFMNEWTLKVNP